MDDQLPVGSDVEAREIGRHAPTLRLRFEGRGPDLQLFEDLFRDSLFYYFQEFARGATVFMYHNDRCTVGIAAHQAARKGRPRVAAGAGKGLPSPRKR